MIPALARRPGAGLPASGRRSAGGKGETSVQLISMRSSCLWRRMAKANAACGIRAPS
jgi:hypothetical protein